MPEPTKFEYIMTPTHLQIIGQPATLCKEKYNGRGVGGGTDLSTGKRDQQFVFEKLTDAKSFLKHPFTKAVILKDYDLVEVD